MATYTYPGVYIQEIPKGPGPVQSASASTCAMIGFTEEGVTDHPVLVTSFPEFTTKFGNFTPKGRLPTSAFSFFQNGGQNLVVVRTVGTGALSSEAVIDEAISSSVDISVTPAPDTILTDFTFSISETPIVPSSITFSFGGVDYSDDGAGKINDDADVDRGTVDYQSGVITLDVAVAPAQDTKVLSLVYQYANLTFKASSAGDWGNDLKVVISGDENSIIAGEFALYNVSIQRKSEQGDYVDVEVFKGVVFDVNGNSFIESVVNDTRRGSDLVTCVASSQVRVPSHLRDVATTNIQQPAEALDGTKQNLTYDLSTQIKTSTLQGSILIGDQVSLDINGLTATNLTSLYALPVLLDVIGSSNVTATVTSSIGQTTDQIVFDQTVIGQTIQTGFSIDGADVANKLVGTVDINPVDGSWTLLVTDRGTSNPVVETLKFELVRKNPLIFEDEGTGEIVRLSSDPDVSLHINGENSINYLTGVISVQPVLAVNGAHQIERGFDSFGVADGSTTFTYIVENSLVSTNVNLAGGSDGVGLLRTDVSAPNLAGAEKGLYALNKADSLLNVCIPDFASNSLVSQDLLDYCDTRKDRFAILSVPEGYSYQEAIDYKRNTLLRNSNRGAIYYPHLKIIDPVTENEINFPAVGHMAGVYARTDSVRNVSKAPAGTTDGRISFATGLEVELTPQQAGFVNSAHVNNLVAWPFTGLVAWGARTLESSGDFPYIQMRRLFMFVEKSVFNSTQGFVFESNTAGLRGAIKLQIEAFLLGLHRSGHFAGNSPAQSFFVICDSSNNPQAQIDQGQLVVDVGIAPTKPAEFIIFRFQQKTLD